VSGVSSWENVAKSVLLMDSVRIAVSVTVMIGSSVLLIVPCEGQNAPASPYPSGVVVVQSRYGNGSISAAVRRAGLGWKVQLPGGQWVYCRRSCAETLRVETVDFFETNAAGSGQLTNECGVFGCLDLKYPR